MVSAPEDAVLAGLVGHIQPRRLRPGKPLATVQRADRQVYVSAKLLEPDVALLLRVEAPPGWALGKATLSGNWALFRFDRLAEVIPLHVPGWPR